MCQSAKRHTPFYVCDYDYSKLLELLADDDVGRTVEVVRNRTNAHYFKEYFEKLCPQTIIVENEYVDSDYLNDFASYYVRCFSPLRKLTRRVHFFRNHFSFDQFNACLSGNNNPLLLALQTNRDAYLGFIVIKPLPCTFIGRTCLAFYPPSDKKKRFYLKRNYDVNLFGISLSVDSLAFQEQDREVSACATSALWSLFHGTSVKFGNKIPSPHAITMAATTNMPDWLDSTPDTRRFPNSGLSLTQIAAAIRDLGLEATLIGTSGAIKSGQGLVDTYPSKRALINSIAYAYLSSGIPILMMCKLEETTNDSLHKKHLGYHAVTLSGYNLSQKWPIPLLKNKTCETTFRAMQIDKLYAHDDQIGAFARMTWNGDEMLDTSWYCLQHRKVEAIPVCLVIALIPKIRVPYEKIERSVIELNQLIKIWVNKRASRPIVWEIRFLTSNQLKAEILFDDLVKDVEKKRLLTIHLPKHLWLVTGWVEDSLIEPRKSIEFIVDATALNQESGFIDLIARDDFLARAFVEVINGLAQDKHLDETKDSKLDESSALTIEISKRFLASN